MTTTLDETKFDICVVCHMPIRWERGSTIRKYYASAMKDPKYKNLPGYVHSTCFNKDYDGLERYRSRTKPKPPTDPHQSKLF